MNKRRSAAAMALLLCVSMVLSGCGAQSRHTYFADPGPAATRPAPTMPENTEPVTEPAEAEAEPVVQIQEPGPYDTIPLLLQTDYVAPFGQHNVATSGCGITCVAMLASYYYEFDYTPDDMAYWFRISTDTGACMDHAILQLQLPLESRHYGNEIFEKIWDALAEGKHILALMMQESIFTTAGHYILITGVTEDGKYLVNDPNGKNYEKENLADGFAHGFTKEEISRGLSGIYIFSAKEDFPCDRENPPVFGKKH